MAENVADDAMLIEMGLTEREYVSALMRIERQTTRTAKQNEERFKQSNRTVTRGFVQANRSASAFAGGGLRMVAMQFSQVAQQGAATNNYLQALAIQAPDLALGFGAVGIAAGAVIPILYGVAQAALGAEKEVENLDVQGAYSTATSAIDAAREAQDRYTAAIRLSAVAQSEVTPEVLANLRLEAQAREALAALEIERLDRQRRTLQANLEADRQQLEELLSTASQGLENDQNAQFANTEVERTRLRNTQDILNANEDLLSSIREQQAELDLVNALIEQGHGEAAELVDQLLNGADAGSRLGGTDMSSGILGALANAKALVGELGVAYATALAIQNVGGGGASGPDAARAQLYDQGRLGGELTGVVATWNSEEDDPSRKSGGRGGSKKKSDAEREAEKEQNRLLSERDRILRSLEGPMETYQRKLADINALKKMGELTGEKYNAALADLNMELQQAEWGAVIDGIESVADAMAGAIVEGENMGEAFRGILQQMARDVIASGIQSALMNIFGFATGGLGGGGGLLSLLFGGRRAAGGHVQAGKIYKVNENGDELFAPQVNGRILSAQQAMRGMQGGGGQVVVQNKTEIINNAGVNVREESQERSDGSRLQRFVLSEMTAGAMRTEGGAANQVLKNGGLRTPRPRR